MKKTLVLLITLSIILVSTVGAGAAEMSSVRYLLSGDSLEIDTLQLEPEFRLNGGQQSHFNLAFDGDNFHAGAGLGLNIISQEQLRMDLHMMITDQVNNQDFGKAIGISAKTVNSEMNFYWKTYYFVDDDIDEHAYYRGGLEYPIGPTSFLDLSLGNYYWDLSEDVINIGIKFNM